MSTVFDMRDSNDRREQLIKRLEDSEWTGDTEKHEWCGEHRRRHEIACSQSVSGFSVIEQLRSRGNGSVGRHQGGTVVARSVDVCWFLGHYEIEIKVDSSAAHAFFHRRGVGRMKHIDSRILWLQDLIACGRCESEEDIENTKLGRHVDAYTKCEGTGGISTVDVSQELQ